MSNHSRPDGQASGVANSADAPNDLAYWLAQPPEERLRHVEYLRRLKYGPAYSSSAKVLRVIEVAKLETYDATPVLVARPPNDCSDLRNLRAADG